MSQGNTPAQLTKFKGVATLRDGLGMPWNRIQQLRRHHERVAASPGDWPPWNYQRQLDGALEVPARSCPAG